MLSDEGRKCESDLVANRARFHDAVKSNYRWRERENREGGGQQWEEAKSERVFQRKSDHITFKAQACPSVTQDEHGTSFWLLKL